MKTSIIHLIGHQGVGKLTIARAICERTGAILVDNHTIANPIFSVVSHDREADGVPESIKQKVRVVRSAVFRAIVEDAPASLSYVLTDVLFESASGAEAYRQAADLAQARNATYVPVRLRCDDDDEYARRVTDPERSPQLKQTNLAISLDRRQRPLLAIDHPNLLNLDVGPLMPAEAASLIISHTEGVA
jgi:hypothetical protein